MSKSILFLCTANSCRSILSEAVFNHYAGPDWRAYSAGSQPKGMVNTQALTTLQRHHISTDGLYSKGVDELAALKPDIVITVCDQAAGEACPVFLGPAMRSHWGLADPSEQHGDSTEQDKAFEATMARILTRTKAFLALPFDELDTSSLRSELDRIGSL